MWIEADFPANPPKRPRESKQTSESQRGRLFLQQASFRKKREWFPFFKRSIFLPEITP